jgi:hypothetical protein
MATWTSRMIDGTVCVTSTIAHQSVPRRGRPVARLAVDDKPPVELTRSDLRALIGDLQQALDATKEA